MKNTLIFLKGANGSGKTKFADLFAECATIISHEQFLEKNEFDQDDMKQAFKKRNDIIYDIISRQQQTNRTIIIDDVNIIVALNAKIEAVAKDNGWDVFHVVIENRRGYKTTKNIPDSVIQKQKESLIKNFKP